MKPSPHQVLRIDRFDKYLVENNLSRTRPRRLLYRSLATGAAMTTPDLVSALKGQIDRATVYRTVEFFLANRIALRTTGGAIELSELFRPHHHHLSCENCGISINVDDDPLERALGDIATRHGFQLAGHQVDLVGICRTCLNSTQPS
jgi:Fur family ferric uptake transcriptional regulator